MRDWLVCFCALVVLQWLVLAYAGVEGAHVSIYGRSHQRMSRVLVAHNGRGTAIFVTKFTSNSFYFSDVGHQFSVAVPWFVCSLGSLFAMIRCIHGRSVIISSFAFRPLRACLAAIFFRTDIDHLLLFLCVLWRGHVHLSVWSICWGYFINACLNFLQRVSPVVRA